MVAVEGPDAAGKRTLAEELARRLSGSGRRASTLSFPAYGSPTGRLLRGHLRGEWAALSLPPRAHAGDARQTPAEYAASPSGFPEVDARRDSEVRQALMVADRCAQVPAILSALEAGPAVLDRYWLSGLAYGTAEGLDPRWIEDASACLPQPDLWVLLDVDPEVAARRRPAARDLNERDFAKLARVRAAYLDYFRRRDRPGEVPRWYVCDASRPAADVADEVWDVVRDLSPASASEYDREWPGGDQ